MMDANDKIGRILEGFLTKTNRLVYEKANSFSAFNYQQFRGSNDL